MTFQTVIPVEKRLCQQGSRPQGLSQTRMKPSWRSRKPSMAFKGLRKTLRSTPLQYDSPRSAGIGVFQRLLMGIFLCVSMNFLYANTSPFVWFDHESNGQVALHMDLFTSSTCVHCQKADVFFRDVEKTTPWLRVHRYVINDDKAALKLFYAHLENDRPINFSVPAMFFCGSRWSGFNDDDSTGKALIKALSYCHQQIMQQGSLSATTIATVHDWGAASQLHIKTHGSRSKAKVLIMMALTDAMNPVSLFCFAAFFAFLWICAPRKSLQLSVGFAFLITTGAIHFIQQTHPSIYEQLVPVLKVSMIWVGLLLILSLISMYRRRLAVMHLNSKPWVYIIVNLVVLVISVYQKTTDGFNLSFVFEQWLLEQSLSQQVILTYQLAYQLIYLLPMILLFFAYMLISNRDGCDRYQRVLKQAGCLILLSMGILFVGYPQGLGDFFLSCAIFLSAIGLAFFLKRLKLC
jgi:hypothetical protein